MSKRDDLTAALQINKPHCVKLPDGQLVEDVWLIGSKPYFEYHCNEAHDSADAELWYRSQQRVEVLTMTGEYVSGLPTLEERCQTGHQLAYGIRFADGYEDEAFEDELLRGPQEYERPTPPERSNDVRS